MKHLKLGLKTIPYFNTVFSTNFQNVKNIMHRNYSKQQQNQMLYFVLNRIKTLNILNFLNFIIIFQIKSHSNSF